MGRDQTVLRIYGCIMSDHHPAYVIMAAAICLLSMLTAFTLARHIEGLDGSFRNRWILLVGFVTGIGIWATHFIAMLAYEPGLPTAYAPAGTLVSVITAIFMSCAGWALQFSGRRHAEAAGAGILTAGIAVMHLIGMSSLKTEGTFHYDPVFVGGSIALAGLLAVTSLHVQRGRLPRVPLLQAACLAGAICVLHFGAMAAVTIWPDPRITIPREAISRDVMTLSISAAVASLIGLAAFAIVLDVRIKATAAEVSRTLSHDPLTGLLNAPAFEREAAQVLSNDGALGGEHALVHVVFDGMRTVFEEHGRKVANIALRELARNLVGGCSHVLAGRVGADHFALLLRRDGAGENVKAALKAVEARLVEPIIIDGMILSVPAWLGASRYPAQAADWDDLWRKAGYALHQAEFSGNRNLLIYDPAMERQAAERHELETALREAVLGQQLALHYQPIACLQTRGVVGFEALLRWHHPKLGSIPPAQFISLAEATGCMPEIGKWVLREACSEAARWGQPLKVAVNLSPAQFADRELVSSIRSALSDSKLPAHRLELEITEGLFIKEGDEAVEILREIKALGVRIVMDDFGTGFSSLGYFRRFPFDKVKIDQSFIRDMIDNRQSMAIVRAVIALGHALGLIVLAEGVETIQQREVLAIEGCDQVQGFAIGRPDIAERFVGLTAQTSTQGHSCGNRCDQCLERLRTPCAQSEPDVKPFYVTHGGSSLAA